MSNDTDAIRAAAAALGRRGGAVGSPAQKAAARENGKRGGRPAWGQATVAAVKRLTNNGRQGSWGTFKHRLMEHLDIPRDQFTTWDVPQDWQAAYCKAAGRPFPMR